MLNINEGKRGEVAEWLKAHAWKVCIRQKRIEGSNPSLSATNLMLVAGEKDEKPRVRAEA